MWKLACEDEAKAPGIFSTSGVTSGHFDFFHVVANGTSNFVGAICFFDIWLYFLCVCVLVRL
jgi:hypothetical protein